MSSAVRPGRLLSTCTFRNGSHRRSGHTLHPTVPLHCRSTHSERRHANPHAGQWSQRWDASGMAAAHTSRRLTAANLKLHHCVHARFQTTAQQVQQLRVKNVHLPQGWRIVQTAARVLERLIDHIPRHHRHRDGQRFQTALRGLALLAASSKPSHVSSAGFSSACFCPLGSQPVMTKTHAGSASSPQKTAVVLNFHECQPQSDLGGVLAVVNLGGQGIRAVRW